MSASKVILGTILILGILVLHEHSALAGLTTFNVRHSVNPNPMAGTVPSPPRSFESTDLRHVRLKNVEVYAKKTWQLTGIFVDVGEVLIVRAIKAMYRVGNRTDDAYELKWVINTPKNWGDFGRCGPEGNPNYSGIIGYALPGAPQGALIGRIGTKVFYIGGNYKAKSDVNGYLELIANDDLSAPPGLGFNDNAGIIVFEVVVGSN